MSGFAVFDRTPPQADGSNGVRPAKRLVKRRVERQTAGDALAFARRRDLGRGGGPNSRRRDADLEADVVGVLEQVLVVRPGVEHHRQHPVRRDPPCRRRSA